MHFSRLALLTVTLTLALARAEAFACGPGEVRINGGGCEPVGGKGSHTKMGNPELDVMSGDISYDPYFSDVEAIQIEAKTDKPNPASELEIDCGEVDLLCSQAPKHDEKKCPGSTHLQLPFLWGPPVSYHSGRVEVPLRVNLDLMSVRVRVPLQLCAEVADSVKLLTEKPSRVSLKGKGREDSEAETDFPYSGELYVENFKRFRAMRPAGMKAEHPPGFTGTLKLKDIGQAEVDMAGSLSLENTHARHVKVVGELHLENSSIEELIWVKGQKIFLGSCKKGKTCWGRIRNWSNPADVWSMEDAPRKK